MTDPAAAPAVSTGRPVWTAYLLVVTCVLVLAMGLTWTFFAMRAVMDVGGSCASGGPYVSSQSCPGGAGLIAVAIPAMLLAAFGGSVPAASSLRSPELFVPMWAFLFGSLGFNFLDFTFRGGVEVGWLVCGVVFELMALPAVLVVLVAVKNAVVPPADQHGSRWWVPLYSLLGAVGFTLGWLSFNALS